MPSAGPHRHVRRGRDRRAASGVVRKWGMDVPTRSVSSSEGEVERGATPPPPSPPRVVSSRHRGVAALLTGPLIGDGRSKCL
jgi:hypothetical protein